jgi:hypothetical protein
MRISMASARLDPVGRASRIRQPVGKLSETRAMSADQRA